MSSCECSYLKNTVSNTALYGTYKMITTKVVNKAPKQDTDVLSEKVSKGKFKNEILMDMGAYALAQYGYWYMKDNLLGYEPDMVRDLPINVVENVYKAGIIALVNYLRGEGNLNTFIRELMLVSAVDATYQIVNMPMATIETGSRRR